MENTITIPSGLEGFTNTNTATKTTRLNFQTTDTFTS